MDINHNFYLALSLPTDAYAEINSDASVVFNGSEGFTISAWIKLNSLGITSHILHQEGVFTFGIDDSSLYFEYAQGIRIVGDLKEKKLNTLEWHFVSASFSQGFLRLYIDGIVIADAGIQVQSVSKSSFYQIGTNLYGKLRNLLIYNRGLDIDELKSNQFNEPVVDGLVSHLDFTQNPPKDLCSGQQVSLKKGAAMVEIHPSVALGGSAYVVPTRGSSINPGGAMMDPYTIHAYLCLHTLSGLQTIFINSQPETDAGVTLYLEYDAQAKGMRVKSLRGTDLNPKMTLSSARVIKANEWVSIATVYDGENLSIFINGVKDATGKFGPLLNLSTIGDPMIGGRQEAGNTTGYQTLQGYISALEVWKSALTDDEIALYSSQSPDYRMEDMTGYFDFTTLPAKNEVNDSPMAFCDGAKLMDKMASATMNSAEQKGYCRNKVDYSIDEELLKSFRSEIDFEQLKVEHSKNLRKVSEKELEELSNVMSAMNLSVDSNRLAMGWKKFIETGAFDFVVTHHIVNKEWVLVVHKQKYSYVAYKTPLGAIDECTLLKIKLLFILIAGILSALFGLSPKLSDKAANFIKNKILILPEISTKMAIGEHLTAANVFAIGATIVKRGLFKDLLRLIIEVGFWFFVRLVAKLVLTFLGVGAVDTIASLIATAALFGVTYVSYIKACYPFPGVAVSAIKFNYDIDNNTRASINLRKNAQDLVRIPEWAPQYSDPVAYIRTQVNNVSIQAKFTVQSVLPYTVRIRANAMPGNFLGDIPAFNCIFAFGASFYNTIRLVNNTIAQSTVGRFDVEWQWQYLDSQTGQWVNMQITRHRVYTLQNNPINPWSLVSNRPGTWPWADALEVTCLWADGAVNNIEVCNRITIGLNNSRFTYEGYPHYAVNMNQFRQFDCTSFLHDVNELAIPQGAYSLECSDCSCVIAIFARLLGVRLNEAGITKQAGTINTTFVRAIGDQAWNEHDWCYHAFSIQLAVQGDIQNTDQVYDSCLSVNATDNPWPAQAPAQGGGFVPGSPGRNMQLSTRPLNAPAVEGVPYVVLSSYRERLIRNTIADKTINELILNENYTII